MKKRPSRTYRLLQMKKVRGETERILQASISKQFRYAWKHVIPEIRRLKKIDVVEFTKQDSAEWWNEWADEWTDDFSQALDKGINRIAASEDEFLSGWDLPTYWNSTDILHRVRAMHPISEIPDDMQSHVKGIITDWYQDPGLTMPDLINRLSPLFGDRRAELIAINETTTLSALVSTYVMQSAGLHQWEWTTARDDVVCPICGDLEGQRFDMNAAMPPDASHIGCRCGVAPVIPDVDTEYQGWDAQGRWEDGNWIPADSE